MFSNLGQAARNAIAGQLVQLDGSQRQSMGLLCGADASSLAVAAPAELILTGASDSRRN